MPYYWDLETPIKAVPVSTWYRPPQSSPDLFAVFERVVDKVDPENLELYLLGDLNCDLLPDSVNANSSHLLNIMDIYGLTQLITEPTRVTQYSRTLIDLCLTNSPDKLASATTVSFSWHAKFNIFALLFIKQLKCDNSRILTKMNFYVICVWMNGTAFPCSITQMKCGTFGNTFWWVLLISTHHWKQKELETKDLHGLQMSCYAKFTKEIFLKKKTTSRTDPMIWKELKDARNKVNNSIKKAKRKYFSEKLDASKCNPRKTWRLINELQSRQCKSTKVSQMK